MGGRRSGLCRSGTFKTSGVAEDEPARSAPSSKDPVRSGDAAESSAAFVPVSFCFFESASTFGSFFVVELLFETSASCFQKSPAASC